jgi:hypothetical protein
MIQYLIHLIFDINTNGLFNSLFDTIKSFGLNIEDVREQGYDNGSNIKGKHKGVQRRLLDINPRALFRDIYISPTSLDALLKSTPAQIL